MDRQDFNARLDANGWCITAAAASTPADLLDEMLAFARTLGEIAPGRSHQLVERIIPQTAETAFAGSLSSRYGLGTLPLHTDTAHWSRPCRYLVMACAEPGPVPTPTLLVDAWHARLSELEELACSRAVFLVRNGRRSFYGSIRERNRGFIRFDPGCMTPVSCDGEIALRAFSPDRQKDALRRHDWKTHEILVIDNWRVLHGRGDGVRIAPGRVLLRAMVQ